MLEFAIGMLMLTIGVVLIGFTFAVVRQSQLDRRYHEACDRQRAAARAWQSNRESESLRTAWEDAVGAVKDARREIEVFEAKWGLDR